MNDEKIQQKQLENTGQTKPKEDWSHLWFYSKYLAELGLVTPASQINTVCGTIAALIYSGTNFSSAHHLFKITQLKEKFRARSRAASEFIELAPLWIEKCKLRGFAGLGVPFLLVYLFSERK